MFGVVSADGHHVRVRDWDGHRLGRRVRSPRAIQKVMDDSSAAAQPEPGLDLDHLVADVLDAAIEVHRTLGPGFLEAIYEQSLCIELGLRGISFARQASAHVHYKGHVVGDARVDLLVDRRLIVELKAAEHLAPIHTAQVMSYLKAMRLPLALLINFGGAVLLRGVRRVILSR